MTFDEAMQELQALGTERTRKIYAANGAHEPQFGVATGDMRSLAKKIKKDQALAERLYATGNYDAMYFAGMILDPKAMTPADFDRWMDAAYFFMLSDYVVAVSLAETAFAQEVADRWIDSGAELRMSAGWACYAWLLGSRPDGEFDPEKLRAMLRRVQQTIHVEPNRARYSMNNFVISVGISYLPLHGEAVEAARAIGKVKATTGRGACMVPLAEEYIRKAAEKGRLGFKRKNVRC